LDKDEEDFLKGVAMRKRIEQGRVGSKISVWFSRDVHPRSIIKSVIIVVIIIFSNREMGIVRTISWVMFWAMSVAIQTLILSTPSLEMSSLVTAVTDSFAHVTRIRDHLWGGGQGVFSEVEHHLLFFWGLQGEGSRGMLAS
jgi:hypothetical protein